MRQRLTALTLVALVLSGAAQAHTGEGVQGGLVSGFTHPLLGLDHLLLLVGVGAASSAIDASLLAFALGFALGVPSIVLLLMNGAMLGAVLHVFISKGLGFEFGGWLLIHGVTELFAIVLAGAAGMRIGWAVAFPGDRSRLEAISETGRAAGAAMMGVVIMLLLAGLLEGFGRQLIVNDWARYAIAAATALIWGLYFYAPRPARVPR
jgi:hypothetical protein